MDDFDIAVLSLGLYVLVKRSKRGSKKGRLWSKHWLQQRPKFTHANLLQELRLSAPVDYRGYLRMDSKTFDELLDLISPLIRKEDTVMRDAISPAERLAITLQYLASGRSFYNLRYSAICSLQSISTIVMETCEAIIIKLQDYMKLPSNSDEWLQVATEFYDRWDLPHCVGAIDGKHVNIWKPPHSGSRYFNYKKFFSIVLLAVVNANYEFLMVDVGINGRISDGGVMQYTEFGRALYSNKLNLPTPKKLPMSTRVAPYIFVADAAFAQHENVMKPYPQLGLTIQEEIFNGRVSRARNVVEDTFGILTSRFEIFQRPIRLSPEKCTTIVLAACYLHNFLRQKQSKYVNKESITSYNPDNGNAIPGDCQQTTSWATLKIGQDKRCTDVAKHIRETFTNYFNHEGARPWQSRYIASKRN